MGIVLDKVSILKKRNNSYLYKDVSFNFNNDYYLLDGKNGIGKSVLLKEIVKLYNSQTAISKNTNKTFNNTDIDDLY